MQTRYPSATSLAALRVIAVFVVGLVAACGTADEPAGEPACTGTYYGDADGDGFGDPAVSVIACEAPPGYVANRDDAAPTCAAAAIDECGVCGGPGPSDWFADTDGDGRGDDRTRVSACEQPSGFVDVFGDPEPECPTDDTDSCGVCAGGDADRDCAGVCFGDAQLDACGACDGPGEIDWFEDTDGDGLGDDATALTGCAGPEGWVDIGGDPEPECATNDTDECGVCAGPGPALWYADVDGDELGDRDAVEAACDQPPGFVGNSDDPEPDCEGNDTDACGICAGPGAPTWFADVDGDGAGDERIAVEACTAPAGFVGDAGDPDPDCATDDTDDCGICAGENADKDCAGVCFGEAALDACNRCTGGATSIPAATADADGDAIPDLCDLCDGEDLERTIIQWTEILPFARGGGPYTFQLVLYSNGEFRFQYFDVEHYEATATVGYQSASGAEALALAFGSNFPTEHPVVHFRGLDDGGVAVEYAVEMTWVDVRHVGTEIVLGDDATEAVDIGFEFSFFGETYEQVTISSNGFVSLSEPIPGYANTNLPNADVGAMLAPLWDDLNPARGGTIYVHQIPAGCAFDCAGMRGGVAAADGCGDCSGGTSGVVPEAGRDCAGVCDGEAVLGVCDECHGGTTGLDPASPEDCPRGPDLLVDSEYLRTTMRIDYLDVEEGSCLIAEECVRGFGRRKLLRFGTMIANVGNTDLRLGRPPSSGESTDLWHWDDCHGHHHFEEYARYDLFDVEADELLPIGAKSGFCVMDIGVYDTEITDRCNGYNCGDQGITAGCQDTYGSSLQCQWIDVTDISDGVYDVIVETNPTGTLEELDYTNNSATARVRITGDEVEVVTEE